MELLYPILVVIAIVSIGSLALYFAMRADRLKRERQDRERRSAAGRKAWVTRRARTSQPAV